MAAAPKRVGLPTPTSTSATTRPPAASSSPAVDDAVERLLIRLNRSKFRSDDKASMTIIAAKGALSIFRILVRSLETGSVNRVINRITLISTHSFARAPAFRFVLANVTRMLLKEIRAAGADLSRAAIRAAAHHDPSDLSALDAAADDDAADEGGNGSFDGEAGDSATREAVSPRAGGMQKAMSFSSYGAPQGLFPRMDTADMPEGEAGSGDVMGEGQLSNASLAERPPTPKTEATIPRIQSHRRDAESYARRLNWKSLKDRANDAIDDLNDTIDSMMECLCEHAPDHVADGDTVLTFGSSHTILRFLQTAAKAGRRFRVVTLAAEPHGNAHTVEKAMALYGIDVSVVPDSEAFNVMPRCTKALLSTEGVLANGGLLAPTGSLMVCLVAKVFSVDVVVVAATLKITPYYPSDTACSSLVKMSSKDAKEMLWTTFSDPARVLPHEHVHPVISHNGMASPLVFNPSVEYVSPEHVSIFVTDKGEFTPAFIHRFLKECYHAEDTHL
uniref:Translation initiation factor eIF2B subunit beta n=1 Tax=Neobodo designis TaxID=312471 RepID=A0A6U4VMU3_NEODS|mmetsp:Transcript_46373/g.143106  ORF Transcript_46373/g.143106 Transcript_46373/m.143106 type:complete len:503 (+) Transcript_46373:45-1553(+)|eukprot:CAMPEP_0174855392 /NCGR_PEP_ID=MMETSP1114-20130205/33154_1 /TAXON_ID=312471 /ORGANISM="Neobodo designis, Strain CCAP 1951/1" /LENGTH=502 /DNA_ID=CAMNT_0016090131 /DNA_START=40 /DNA_END=1548 /DNA_ORIENTATION=+